VKEKVLVSACLLGIKVRFDGKSKANEELIEKLNNYEFIPVCPEVWGGLTTPRVPSEIINDKVINKDGIDVTDNYMRGAIETLELARKFNIKKAILKSKSPSCGKGKIYDGSFTGILVDGNGITTRLLIENGIEVLSEDEFLGGL
jgi:uncharacterized protein YbbK (DUF523 family)